MKILYAIQGTGNGHICRAYDIVPVLQKRADVDVLISGISADLQAPFDVRYRMNGLSFIFGKKGGVDLLETYKKSRLRSLLKEVKSLDLDEYDLVISDFEPVSAWACALAGKPCIALSHQAAVMSRFAPRSKNLDPVGSAILKLYAPTPIEYGFHFRPYADNIFTPVIRQEVRNAPNTEQDHYTVYLPAYSDTRILKVLSQLKQVKWQVFSKHFKEAITCDNVVVYPLNNEMFVKSMASSRGVLCGAGFETPSEALFLKKKLLVIPMKNQYEQQCNAVALKHMGVEVINSLKMKHLDTIARWIEVDNVVTVAYPDQTDAIIDRIIHAHVRDEFDRQFSATADISLKDFRKLTLKKILYKLAN